MRWGYVIVLVLRSRSEVDIVSHADVDPRCFSEHAASSRCSHLHRARKDVDPRFWRAVAKWRREEQKRRRLTHNAALGEEAPRHSSVHFFYHPSSGASSGISAWYNEVTVTARSEDSFYNVNGNGYGYAGIQSVDMSNGVMSKGKVLFSIWDQLCTGDDMNDCPEDKRVVIDMCCEECTCERFGGEGTGGKAWFYYDTWTMNTAYSFLTTAEAAEGNQVIMACYFFAPEDGFWRIMGRIRTNRGDRDWAIHGHSPLQGSGRPYLV
jgi:hypothetical protein